MSALAPLAVDMSFAASLARFDIYSSNKTHDDLKVRTLGGAGISIVMSVFAVILLVTEFRSRFCSFGVKQLR